MSQTEQLERETERTRTQIADTLDELRARMTPGHVMDELADRVGRGATVAFARNLKEQTVSNPLPVALIGAGLAWLMLSPRGDGRIMKRSRDVAENAGEGLSSVAERARQAGADAADAFRGTAASGADAAREGAAETADSIREATGSALDSTREAASEAADSLRGSADSTSQSMHRAASAGYEAMADRARRTSDAIAGSTRAAGQRTLQSGSAFLDFCREQPLIVAGLGLALGAAMGALLPASEAEDRLMGESSDRVKGRAQDLATEQYESAKKVGERAVDAAKEEARKQANKEENTGASKDDQDAPTGEGKAEEATLVPSDESELERRGQPWTAKDAPL